ncbi:MAG: sulfatase-like hydrolase/transferase [Verrucomicrobiota bacterium]|jgi:hypothetical protein
MPPAEHYEGTIPLPQPLKQKVKDGLVAFSAANLCFTSAWFTMLYDQDYGYFNRIPVMAPSLLALLMNIFGLAAVIWLAMCLRRRFPNRALHFGLHLAFLALLLIPMDFARDQILHIVGHQVVVFLMQPVMLVCIPVFLALIVWQHHVAAQIAAVLVGVMAPLAFFTTCKIVLLCLSVTHLSQSTGDQVLQLPGPVSGDHPRVVWIIFDCADYRLAFEQRPASVLLPEFDRLRGKLLFCVNACSPGNSTISSMPALISGRRISEISIASAADLNCTLADTREKTTWGRMPSVFAEAQALGANTALIGWYHPYDRVLGDGLNYCKWYAFPSFEPARAPTFTAAMRRQIACMVWPLHLHRIYVSIYQDGLRESLSLVTNATYGLILLHLIPPHLPGIYLPDKNELTPWGKSGTIGYYRNLALADLELGKLRQAMEASGEWDKTWLIISSDHSWAGSVLYDGRQDTRVPFIVKPPGKNEAITYSPAINTVLTHDLILAILRNQIINQQDLVPWLDKHGKPWPTLGAGKQQ